MNAANDEEWQREGNVECVSCPRCAFTFDAAHILADGSYSCPNCAEERLQEQLQTERNRGDLFAEKYEDASASASGYRADRDRLQEQLKVLNPASRRDDAYDALRDILDVTENWTRFKADEDKLRAIAGIAKAALRQD